MLRGWHLPGLSEGVVMGLINWENIPSDVSPAVTGTYSLGSSTLNGDPADREWAAIFVRNILRESTGNLNIAALDGDLTLGSGTDNIVIHSDAPGQDIIFQTQFVNQWHVDDTGDLNPVTDLTDNIGDATHHVLVGYFQNLRSSGQTMFIGTTTSHNLYFQQAGVSRFVIDSGAFFPNQNGAYNNGKTTQMWLRYHTKRGLYFGGDTDANAINQSVYYSTDQVSELAYKDSGGTVKELYEPLELMYQDMDLRCSISNPCTLVDVGDLVGASFPGTGFTVEHKGSVNINDYESGDFVISLELVGSADEATKEARFEISYTATKDGEAGVNAPIATYDTTDIVMNDNMANDVQTEGFVLASVPAGYDRLHVTIKRIAIADGAEAATLYLTGVEVYFYGRVFQG